MGDRLATIDVGRKVGVMWISGKHHSVGNMPPMVVHFQRPYKKYSFMLLFAMNAAIRFCVLGDRL